MSFLSSLFAPRDEQRGSQWFINDDQWWGGSSTASGARVSRESAMRLSAVFACVRLLTNTVSTLPKDIVVSVGGQRFVEFNPPRWLREPDPADPTMTATEHFAQVTTSLLLDGNFFVYVEGGVFEPEALIVLDPRRVEVRADRRMPLYDIRDEKGRIVRTVSPLQMLHGAWLKMPGALRGMSPIEAARQAIGLGLTAEEFGARFFGQGTTLSFGVEVPGALTDQQRDDLRKGLEGKHAGVGKAHSISIISSGAKFVPGLGVTNDQAQFLELRKFQIEDIARWYGIPPHMLGSQEPGASSYNSVEQRGLEFREYAVLPLVRRLEDVYDRMIEPPDRLREGGATAALRFNLSGLARADLKSRYEAYQIAVGGPFLAADEVRELEDRAPISGGDRIYVQSQMVPLGTPPQQPTPPSSGGQRSLMPSSLEVHAHVPATPAPQVRVEAPLHVHVPQQPAPVVNVPEGPAPVVNVDARAEAPVVNVEAPAVTVQTPDTLRIAEMPARMTTRKVTKRTATGAIAETVDLEADV